MALRKTTHGWIMDTLEDMYAYWAMKLREGEVSQAEYDRRIAKLDAHKARRERVEVEEE